MGVGEGRAGSRRKLRTVAKRDDVSISILKQGLSSARANLGKRVQAASKPKRVKSSVTASKVGISVVVCLAPCSPLHQAKGFALEADKREDQGEISAAPAKLAGESYQTLFEQVRRIHARVLLLWQVYAAPFWVI